MGVRGAAAVVVCMDFWCQREMVEDTHVTTGALCMTLE
jgi:hypothetical protein